MKIQNNLVYSVPCGRRSATRMGPALFPPRSGRADYFGEIIAVSAFLQRFGQNHHLVPIDEAEPEGDFLEARDLHTLPLFQGLNETGGLDQRFEGPGVEPGKSSPHPLDP